MDKVKKTLIIMALVGVFGGIGYLWWSSDGWTYSEGSRAGTVVKFSKRGSFVKTWEGQLAMGVNKAGAMTLWNFSVYEKQDGKGIIKQVEDSMDSGRRVKIHYRQQRGRQSWKGDTTYFVTKVEYLGK